MERRLVAPAPHDPARAAGNAFVVSSRGSASWNADRSAEPGRRGTPPPRLVRPRLALCARNRALGGDCCLQLDLLRRIEWDHQRPRAGLADALARQSRLDPDRLLDRWPRRRSSARDAAYERAAPALP